MPFFFDLSNRGAAGDPQARAFLVKAKPQFGKGMVPTPPVFFMNAQGKVLGEISNYAKPDDVLKTMLHVLAINPAYAKPSDAEKAIKDPIELANLRIDLQDYAGAQSAIAHEKSEDAAYLRGRIARFQKDWKTMETNLAPLKKSEKYGADVRMETAYKLWFASDFEGLRKHLEGFPEDSNRYTEARYYEGLAAFHLKDKEAAMKIWSSTIRACAQDPWIYRADWAYTQSKKGGSGRGGFSSAGPRDSLLNRIGYMGNPNPDLKGPSSS